MDFFFLLAQLGQVFAQLANLIAQVFLFLYQLIQAVFVFLWNTLVAVAQFLLRGFLRLGHLLRVLWDRVLKRGVLKLIELYQRLRDKLEKYLDPVLKIIRRIRRILDDLFNKYVAPILNLIQRVRKILAVLRILHVKFAERLDQRLAQIEGKIAEAFNFVRSYLNLVSNIINLVLDPQLLIRPGIFGGSVGSWLATVGALFGAVGLGVGVTLTGFFSPSQMAADINTARAGERNWLEDGGRATVKFYERFNRASR